MTLERIRQTAQAGANRDGKPLAILDLNKSFGHLYVIRNWDDRFVGTRDFVERVDPEIAR